MFLIYNILLPILFLFYLPFYLIHIIKRGGLTKEYWQRFGFFGKEIREKLAGLKSKVWVHAVSVGESVAAVTFIKAWQKAHPEDSVVFTCSTSTAFETMRKKNLPNVVLMYCPIDFYWAVRTALKIINPHTLAIFEVEIWPNLILQAAKRGVKVCLVNGRMSDKSSQGYAKYKWIFKPILDSLAVICVQTEEDAARVERVVGNRDRIKVCDTMKFDQVPDVGANDVSAVLDAAFGNGPRTTFVAGSTHPGEEELVCEAMKALKPEYPELKMVLVPRHCERGADVCKVVASYGLTCKAIKPLEGQAQADGPVDVLLVNTTGELMNFYGAADIAYVGKSMAGQTGGHNIIEPAIFGKAIIHGPHMENFRAVAAIFKERKASLEVAEDAQFTAALKRLLANPAEREELGRNARATVDRYRGAIERTIKAMDSVSASSASK
ncbi:MAG: 3-deoxy-D-manno-octulosonic acid transferase [Victivallales bacterium]|nr:3-deoxy-D-manno-octulosonic acid transferase [Victivallales bacterium]